VDVLILLCYCLICGCPVSEGLEFVPQAEEDHPKFDELA
jgi:hypothetical protein